MKHRISASVLLTLMVLFFTSCGESTEDLLFYQSQPLSVTGTLVTETGEFYVRITLCESLPDLTDEDGGKIRRDMSVEILSPESVEGIAVVSKEGAICISLGELCLPVTHSADMLADAIERMFSLEEDSLSSIKKSEDGTFTAYFGGDYVKFPPASSYPCEIGSDGDVLMIDGFFLE